MRTIRDCPVAVVGGAGFLGSHLVDHLLLDRGCKVLVVDNLVAGRLEWIPSNAEFMHHDITGSEYRLKRAFKQFGVQFAMNWAAYPYVPDSYDQPGRVFDVNANGAIKVINAAQEAGAEAILQVSSAELYGDGPDIHIEDFDTQAMLDEKCNKKELDESAPVAPHSTYGAAKAAVDWYCQTAWKERQTPVIALRQFNCVGERETHPYVVPEIVSQLETERSICEGCKGTGQIMFTADDDVDCMTCGGLGYLYPSKAVVKLGNNSTRDFLYAGDAVRIAVELLERGKYGEVYNLGSETGIKIYDLAKLIGKLMGFADVRVEEDATRKRAWEIWHLQSCNDKLWSLFPSKDYAKNWITPLEESLKRTIVWFEGNGRRWPWQKQ